MIRDRILAAPTNGLVFYVAHPLTGDVEGNLARAKRWLRALMEAHPEATFCLPWSVFCELGSDDDEAYRARCLRDDVAIAGRCDGIVLCGGRVSAGMLRELGAVLERNGLVVDLTTLGDEPTA